MFIKKIVLFDILPGLISAYFIVNDNFIFQNHKIIDYLLITCSIFSGLLFSLIVVIVDKAKRIKETKNTQKEEDFYYLKKYLRFSKQLVTKISFSIILALTIIIIATISSLSFGIGIDVLSELKPIILSFSIFYFSIQFGILIVNIISDMYEVSKEEIDN